MKHKYILVIFIKQGFLLETYLDNAQSFGM